MTKEIKLINMERFLSKINASENCWIWKGKPSTNGYGRYKQKGEQFYAHRISFTIFKEKIKNEHVIDHICKNRMCVNPDHLRQVTTGENTTNNSNAPSAFNKLKTICIRGHDLSGENLRYEKGKQGLKRICKTCKKLQKLK